MEEQFWVLKSPQSAAPAEWDHGKVKLESLHCPANKGHQRRGSRLTDLSVVLSSTKVTDFIWTCYGECMVRNETLSNLHQAGLTGFDVKPVSARFKRSEEVPPKLWEVTLNGWGGMANPASGIRLDESKSCLVCGKLKYTGLSNANVLIDKSQWDGSDVFMVWPMPAYLFVTSKVVHLIRDQNMKGVDVLPVSELQMDESVIPGFSPGRLSNWMPKDRAKKLGERLGIY